MIHFWYESKDAPKVNLITVACKPEKTCIQRCLLCEPETHQSYLYNNSSYIFMTESQILTGPFNIMCHMLSLLFTKRGRQW